MAWLLRHGDVLASLERPISATAHVRGFAARPDASAVLLLEQGWIVHAVGVGCGLDVAYLDAERTVIEVLQLGAHRIARPRPRACAVLEAQAGTFERWRLQVGDALEVKE